MRICFINPQGHVTKHPPLGQTDTGGQIVYVLELAAALGRKGAYVDIVTRQFGEALQIEEVTPYTRIIRIPCGPPDFVIKELLADLLPEMVRRLHRFIRDQHLHYDVIHSHYWDGGYVGRLLKNRLQIAHVFTPHSLGKWKERDMASASLSVDLTRLYGYQTRIAAEKKIMKMADVLLMLSQIQRVRLLQHYRVDFNKIRVLYPGVDTHIFNPVRTAVDATTTMPTHQNILLVSRFVPPKGIASAVDLMHLLVQKIDCHLYIITTNQMANASQEEIENERLVQHLIRDYRLENRVTFLGFIADREILAGYYRAADLFLLPSRYEPFGMTTLEAMACGTPALISRAAGSRELIVDGVNGYIVNMQEREELVDLILELFANKKQRQRIAENAVLTIQRHFSWDITAHKLLRYIYPLALGHIAHGVIYND